MSLDRALDFLFFVSSVSLVLISIHEQCLRLGRWVFFSDSFSFVLWVFVGFVFVFLSSCLCTSNVFGSGVGFFFFLVRFLWSFPCLCFSIFSLSSQCLKIHRHIFRGGC
jgi:hypothetical protein